MLFEASQLSVERSNSGATIVIVTYNSAQTILECLQSVESSLRPNDNVVLIDNRSSDRTLDLIREFILHREQYALIENHENLGYAAAANQGALTGSNPYIVFLNPDTIVTPRWLDQLAFHLQAENIAAVGPLSNCVAGLQKAAFHLPASIDPNIDPQSIIAMLWRKHQRQCVPTKLLVGFCLMIKRHVFDEVGGMDGNLFLGNDDLDICWRLTLAGYQLVVAKDTIVFHKGQESFKSEPKSTTDVLVQESTDYLYYKLLRKYGIGRIPSAQDLWGIDWFRPSCRFRNDRPLASIIILTWNQLRYTQQCIESILMNTCSPFELILVDNGSTDGTAEYIQTLDRTHTACISIKVIANTDNAGFAKGCNQGLAVFNGDYAVLLNNDVVVTSEWLTRLVRAFDDHPQLGLVGPMTNFVAGPQQVVNPAYDTHDLGGLAQYAEAHASRYSGQIESQWRIAGLCMAIRRSVIDKIGGLDERYAIGNFEDDDFCVRAHLAGFQAAVVKDCYLHHYGSRTFSGNKIDYAARMNANWTVFKKKWNIPEHTPLGHQYNLSMPAGGFNAAAHFVSLTPNLANASISINAGSKGAGPSVPAHLHSPQALPVQMQTNIAKNNMSGGNPMSIVDQVYEFTKQQIAPDHKDAAIWILERICEESYDHAYAHHELGLLYFERNEPDNAQQHLERALSIEPKNPTFAKDLGDFFHVVRKDARRALEAYLSVLQSEPDDRDTLLKAGHLYMASRQFDMAKECYSRLLALDPHHAEARTFIDKIESMSSAAVSQVSPETLYEQAHERLAAGDSAGAVDLLNRMIEIDPQNALAHNDLGVLSFNQNEKEKALHHYKQAAELVPNNITFLKNLADFYWVERKDAREALEQYVQVLQLEPSDVETLLNCGQICKALNKDSDARDFYDRAQQIEPWNENIGKLLNDLRSDDTDIPQPVDRESLYQQAKAKAAAGDVDGAITDLTRILQQEPQNATLCNDIGVLNFDLGNMSETLSYYEQAVALAPDQTLFKKNLAEFYLIEQGRAEDAMKLYVSILEKDPYDVDSLLACGLVCICMQNSDDARVFFQRVLDIEPWNASAKQGLEQLNTGNGNRVGDAGLNSLQSDNFQMVN